MATLPASGTLSLNEIGILLGKTSGSEVSFGDTAVQNLLKRATSAETGMDDFYGVELPAPQSWMFSFDAVIGDQNIQYSKGGTRVYNKNDYDISGIHAELGDAGSAEGSSGPNSSINDADVLYYNGSTASSTVQDFVDDLNISVNDTSVSSSDLVRIKFAAHSVTNTTSAVFNDYQQPPIKMELQFAPVSNINVSAEGSDNTITIENIPKKVFVYDGNDTTTYDTSIADYRCGTGWTTTDAEIGIETRLSYLNTGTDYNLTIRIYYFPRTGLDRTDWYNSISSTYTESSPDVLIEKASNVTTGDAGLTTEQWQKVNTDITISLVTNGDGSVWKSVDVTGEVSSWTVDEFNKPTALPPTVSGL